jgi:hypothetical protein
MIVEVVDRQSTSGCPAIGQMAGIRRKIPDSVKTLWDLPDEHLRRYAF